MGIMTVGSYELTIDYVHPNFNKFIELPPFHGCGLCNNRNGKRKFINYTIGEHCVAPTWQRYWKKDIKPKYKTKIGFFYWTRYLTQTRDRYLFKKKVILFIIISLKSMNI